MSDKHYDTPPRNLKTIEVRLRNLIGSDGVPAGLFSRLRQEIANVIIGQVLAGVVDDTGKPVFLIKGGVAMSFRLGLRARPTRDFDVACRIDRDAAIELLRDALTRGWSGFTFVLKSGPEEIRDTGAVSIDIQEQFNGQIFSRVKFEMSQSEGQAGQEFDLVQHQLIELERLGLQQPDALPMVTAAYLIAQKLHACTDHGDRERPNDRFRDLIDVLLIEATLEEGDLAAVRAACVEIFALRAKHAWPPVIEIVEGWEEGYADLAARLGYEINSVHDAKTQVDAFISRIDRARTPPDKGTERWLVDFRGVLNDEARAAMERIGAVHLTSSGSGTLSAAGGDLPEMTHHQVWYDASTRTAAIDAVGAVLRPHGTFVAFRARRAHDTTHVEYRSEDEAETLARDRIDDGVGVGVALWRDVSAADEDGITVECVVADERDEAVVDVSVPRAESLTDELALQIETRLAKAVRLFDRYGPPASDQALARSPYSFPELWFSDPDG